VIKPTGTSRCSYTHPTGYIDLQDG
jgi:hypothetical protein